MEASLLVVAVSDGGYGCVQEAEDMHLKAIAIKERLLGADDYEVALSVGHLASLYNYDMNKYDDAERLYLRSIAIGLQPLATQHLGPIFQISYDSLTIMSKLRLTYDGHPIYATSYDYCKIKLR